MAIAQAFKWIRRDDAVSDFVRGLLVDAVAAAFMFGTGRDNAAVVTAFLVVWDLAQLHGAMREQWRAIKASWK